jgi:hypothetical protein
MQKDFPRRLFQAFITLLLTFKYYLILRGFQQVLKPFLKGLSHEMDLAVDDIYGYF